MASIVINYIDRLRMGNCLAYLKLGCMNFNYLTPIFTSAIKNVQTFVSLPTFARIRTIGCMLYSAALVSSRHSCTADVTKEKHI